MNCIDCAKPLSTRNVTGRCRGCAGSVAGRSRRKHPDKQCSSCGIDICRYGETSFCRACFISECLHTPEMQQRRTAGLRKHAETNRDRMRLQLKINHRNALKRPEYIEYLRQRMKILQPLAVIAGHAPEALAKRSLSIRKSKQPKPAPKPKMTFEERLQAVLEGRATIYTVPTAANTEHEFTLGGVSSGWAA